MWHQQHRVFVRLKPMQYPVLGMVIHGIDQQQVIAGCLNRHTWSGCQAQVLKQTLLGASCGAADLPIHLFLASSGVLPAPRNLIKSACLACYICI